MNLACVINRSLAAARTRVSAYTDATMQDTVRITRPGHDVTFSYSSGLANDAAPIIYSGPAWTGTVATSSSEDAADELQFFDSFPVTLPDDAAVVQVDDVLTVTTSANTLISGRSYRVSGVARNNALAPTRQKLTVVGVTASRVNT